jgi:iron complex outermembrane receptor protein
MLGPVVGTLLSIVAGVAGAQTPPASTTGEESLGTVVVTGSMLRRTDTETPSPVSVITSLELQQSGYTDVSDVLRNLTANGQGTLSQSFNNAFAGGASGVALRGLTVGATLTLIDGHRMVAYPLSDDGQRSFVDVSSIPFSAIDRIEVLKDGASAEYGSDAIAGVVNVILKKTYVGSEVTAEAGTTQQGGGNMTRISGIAGTGDLAQDGYNMFLSFEWRHQDNILVADRNGAFTNTDWTSIGGVNTTPGAANNPALPYPFSTTGYLINPNTASGQPYAYLPGCNATAQAANQCTYSEQGLELQPETSNFNVVAKLTKSLASDWQATVTASSFRSTSDQVFPPLTVAFGSGYFNTNPQGGGIYNIGWEPGHAPVVYPYPYSPITVPANYPGNPFGAPAELVYSFHELGVMTQNFETNTYRLVAEVTGAAAGWDMSASGGMMYAKTNSVQLGGLEPVALQAALNNGYLVGQSADATASTAESLFAPPAAATASSVLNFINVHGSRELLQLPGGPLSLGAGAEFFQKLLNNTAPPTVASGVQYGNVAFAIGGQDDTAGFVELNMPLAKQLEVNAAVRYDHYNTFGSSTTPKFGLKFTPIRELSFRGTWGKGFRAPNVAESGNSGETFGAAAVPDPILCPHPSNPNTPGNFPTQCAIALVGAGVPNPALQPEKSTNLTVGLIFEPSKSFNVSADYYEIKINQDIVSSFESGGLLSSTYVLPAPVRGTPVKLPFVNPNGTISNVLTPIGPLLYQPYPYVNASQDKTSGIDIDMKARLWDSDAAGRLTAEFNYTHIIEFDLISANGVVFDLAGTHGPSGVSGDTGNPKDRAALSLTWDRGPASITGTLNYIGSFNITDPSAGQNTCAQALVSNITLEYFVKFVSAANVPSGYCNVASFTDVDLYGRYTIGNQVQLHASVLNVFNQPPPVDIVTYGGGGGAAYDAALHQAGAVGRFYTVGVTYKF